MPTADSQYIIVPNDFAGQRLDSVLAQLLPELSRSSAIGLIRSKNVTIENIPVKPSLRLKGGEQVKILRIPPSEPPLAEPQPISLEIIHEDDDIVIINKPAGMVVHPAPGNYKDTLVNALLYHFPQVKELDGERPGIVHRLDKETSGVMVVAKNQIALRRLGDQFQSRSLKKIYLALVWGIPKQNKGEINYPIGRHPTDRKKMSIHSRKGRSAQTQWRIKTTFLNRISLLEIEIKTGRTHQIRVHCAAINHSVVGDPVYGGQPNRNVYAGMNQGIGRQIQRLERQMLHAWKLSIVHPISKIPMEFAAPVPADMEHIISKLGTA